MSTTDRPIFDHVAIAVERWSDGYECFVRHLGGAWRTGGDTGVFAPAQFAFHDDIKVELVTPGREEGNFVSRFLAGTGPGAHHLTWCLPDMDEFERGCRELGLDLLPTFFDFPGRREAFVHPRTAGFGTLLQAIADVDDRYEGVPPAPQDLPPSGDPHEVCWVALGVPDLGLAGELFGGVLAGRVRDRGDAAGRPWTLFEWSVARRLLVVERDVAGPRPCGVDHVMFGPVDGPLPDPSDALVGPRPVADAAIGLAILEVPGVRN